MNFIKRLPLLLVPVAGLLLPSLLHAQESAVALETRVDDLLRRLTPDEKLTLLGGTGFATPAIPRFGVPALNMIDAGQGARGGIKSTEGPATAFPAGVTMASTWDPGLIGRVARAIGEETWNKGTGTRVPLGPAVNIHCSPLGGRDGEYFSEDPFLATRLAVGYIRGMQGTGVPACVKHFACNNHEYDRFNMDVRVGERALRKIYFPAFEAAVKEGKVWMVMSSYNKVNGTCASANRRLLADVLKRGRGFDGMVTSDWGAVHETASVQAGNDLEMPDHKFETPDKLRAALADGSATQAAVDDAVRRILRKVVRVGLLDHPSAPDPAMVNSPAHRQLAYEVATEGAVLLKNRERFLPLDRRHIHSVGVIGEAVRAAARHRAGGRHPRKSRRRGRRALRHRPARGGARVRKRGDARRRAGRPRLPGRILPQQTTRGRSRPRAGGTRDQPLRHRPHRARLSPRTLQRALEGGGSPRPSRAGTLLSSSVTTATAFSSTAGPSPVATCAPNSVGGCRVRPITPPPSRPPGIPMSRSSAFPRSAR